MEINNSISQQLNSHIQKMHEKNLKGDDGPVSQSKGECQVKSLTEALEDNQITGEELDALRNEYAKQGVNTEEFDKSIADVFGISVDKIKNAGSSDAVIKLDMEDSGKTVTVNPKGENKKIMTSNILIMDDKTMMKYTKDPEIQDSIQFGLKTPKGGNQIKNLQQFLNDYKLPGKESLKPDGLFGNDTVRALKDVFADALKNKNMDVMNQLIDLIETLNNKINPPWEKPIDTELSALTNAGKEIEEKNSKTKLTIGPIEVK